MIEDHDGYPVDVQMLMQAYWAGCFPMAEQRHGRLAWYRPRVRAIITWDRLRCRRSLRKVMAREPYQIAIDRDFPAVIAACADRADTWICRDIEDLFCQLHASGQAHCVAVYDATGRLVGGCYGLALGGIFCGESMFHRAPDASKIAVWRLICHLRERNFLALDCQQSSPHMQGFGAYEISAEAYAELLQQARFLAPQW